MQGIDCLCESGVKIRAQGIIQPCGDGHGGCEGIDGGQERGKRLVDVLKARVIKLEIVDTEIAVVQRTKHFIKRHFVQSEREVCAQVGLAAGMDVGMDDMTEKIAARQGEGFTRVQFVPIVKIMPEVKADADVTVSCGAYVFDGIQHERGTVTVDLAGQKTIVFERKDDGTAVRIAVVCQGREQRGVVVKVGKREV